MLKKRLLFWILGICMSQVKAQSLSIQNFLPGNYTRESGISVLFDIVPGTTFSQDNSFGLYLSDASGDFTNEVKIGQSNGFYANFVNGIIPAAAVTGTGYRLRIKTTSPATVGPATPPFQIVDGASVNAKISSTSISNDYPEVFGFCSGVDQYNFYLENQSDAGAQVNAQIFNENNNQLSADLDLTATIASFKASLTHYSILVSARMPDGRMASKSYLLVNNRAITAFGTSGNNTVCLPDALLQFNVTVSGADGIENNYPGTLYHVIWGDGSEDRISIFDIIESNGRLEHTYTESSCGKNVLSGGTTIYNAFGITISSENTFCGVAGTPVSSFAKVINKPRNDFTGSGACLNQSASFVNTSVPGQDPSSNSPGCENQSVTYTWLVDGQVTAVNKPKSFVFTHTFSTPGNHTVRLEASGNAPCLAEPFEKTICVQAPPQASFLINGSSNGTKICAGDILTLQNTSVVEETCSPVSYQWVIDGGRVTYLNQTTPASRQPQISFPDPGIYQIRLELSQPNCSTVSSTTQKVVVNQTPTAQLSADLTLCNLSAYTFNESTEGPTKVSFSGTAEEENGTYTWQISGGAFQFINGTSNSSKFPVINFTEYTTYTISVTHTNNCGTANDSQILHFQSAPVVNAGVYDSICYQGQVSLNGSISGPVNTYAWIGGTGTFIPDRNTLNPVYVPSAEERNEGHVELTLRAETNLEPPCQMVEGFTTIGIRQNNVVTSASLKELCTGQAVSYEPQAISGSTFSWTVAESVNVNGAQSGSGTRIEDILTHSGGETEAYAIYRIIPQLNTCEGQPFDFKVSVEQLPSFIVSAPEEICNGQKTGIQLQSDETGTTYIWSSTSSDPSLTGNSQSATPVAISQIEDILINPSANSATVSYQITPVSAKGCTGESRQVVIRVKAAAINQIATSQEICNNQIPAALTGNDPSQDDISYTFQWQKSEDKGNTWTDISTATNSSFQPEALTTTTLFRRIISNAACTGGIPNISNSVAITVNLPAKALFTYSQDTGCTPFNLATAGIMAESFPENDTYSWYANEQLIGTGINFPGYTIETPGTTIVIKLATNSAHGCQNSEFSHEFKTQQSISALFSQSQKTSCGTAVVSFSNLSSSADNLSYLWDFGNGQTSTERSPQPVQFAASPDQSDITYPIALTVTSPCGITATYESDFTVRSIPKAVFSPNKTVGCTPLTINFSNTSSDNQGTIFTFDFGDGSPLLTTTDKNSVQHTFTTGDEVQTFTVTMTARNECGESSRQHLIKVTPPTVIAELVVNGPDQTGCAPFTVPFYNNSSGGATYHLDFGDGNTVTTTSAPQQIDHTYLSEGTYTVTLTAENSCSTVSTTETIVVLAKPVAGFIAPESTHVAETVQFTDDSSGGEIYQWDFGDGTSSAEKNPQHIYQQSGAFLVKLIVSNYNGCRDEITRNIRVEEETGKLYLPNAFIPNGSNPELQLFKAKGYGLESYTLWILNKWGEVMWETSLLTNGEPAEGWDGTYQGQLLPAGTYFWRMEAQFKSGRLWKGMSYKGESPKTTGIINLIR